MPINVFSSSVKSNECVNWYFVHIQSKSVTGTVISWGEMTQSRLYIVTIFLKGRVYIVFIIYSDLNLKN